MKQEPLLDVPAKTATSSSAFEPIPQPVQALRECAAPVEKDFLGSIESETAKMITSVGGYRPEPARTLKIEACGDFWKGVVKPKIRLTGRWLERAGFKPGEHVRVSFIAPGLVELRSGPTPDESGEAT